MKSLSLLFAFAFSGLVLAQEPAAPENPAPEPPTPAEKPLEKLLEKPAITPTENPADLPPLPDPSPGGEAGELMKNQPGSRLKPAPQREPGLVPDGIVRPGERPKSRSTLKPPTTSADLAARIRYREAHSRAVNEPKIQALWTESRQVPTDGQKRDALRRYYGALYSRILALDKTVAPIVEERRRVSLKRLDQTRVEPTDPLEDRSPRD